MYTKRGWTCQPHVWGGKCLAGGCPTANAKGFSSLSSPQWATESLPEHLVTHDSAQAGQPWEEKAGLSLRRLQRSSKLTRFAKPFHALWMRKWFLMRKCLKCWQCQIKTNCTNQAFVKIVTITKYLPYYLQESVSVAKGSTVQASTASKPASPSGISQATKRPRTPSSDSTSPKRFKSDKEPTKDTRSESSTGDSPSESQSPGVTSTCTKRRRSPGLETQTKTLKPDLVCQTIFERGLLINMHY